MKTSIFVWVLTAALILFGNTTFGYQTDSNRSPAADESAIQQAAASDSPELENQDTSTEYDDWRGSSIGARISIRNDGFYVTKVLPHVDDSPLMEGDRILAIGPIDATAVATFLRDLRKFLGETAPATTVKVTS